MHGMMEREARSTRLLSLDSMRTFFFFFCVTDRRDAMLIIVKTREKNIATHQINNSQVHTVRMPLFLLLGNFCFFFFPFLFFFILFNGDDKVIVYYVVDLLSIAFI